MEDRKKLTAMLRDFQAEQRELLAQAEQRLEVTITCRSTFFVSKKFFYIFLFSFTGI